MYCAIYIYIGVLKFSALWCNTECPHPIFTTFNNYRFRMESHKATEFVAYGNTFQYSYLFLFIYLFLILLLIRGRPYIWRGALRRDQTFRRHAILERQTEGQHQVGRRYATSIISRRLEVSFGRKNPGVRAQNEALHSPRPRGCGDSMSLSHGTRSDLWEACHTLHHLLPVVTIFSVLLY